MMRTLTLPREIGDAQAYSLLRNETPAPNQKVPSADTSDQK